MWPFRNKQRPQTVAPEEPLPTPEYGHYHILRRENGELWELGSGAMGLTYKAEDINLRSPVALKVISPLIVELPGAREFFLAEARGAASLRHRNAAAVHHLGVNRAGELFFAMEFIEGETVEVLIRRQRRLAVPLALDIAQQTACALAAAAHRRLVHRDLKPANLMLANEDDGTLLVKVIDFGLCKSLRVDQASAGSLQARSKKGATNQFLGTPHYASPEQVRSDAALDHRSDFYSLGATLWTMLAGGPVFSGSLSRVRQRHLEEEPPFSELPEEVSPPVRALLARLLQKDAADRPQTPLELIDLIEGAAYDHRGAEADPRKHWNSQGCLPLVGSVLAHNYHLEAVAEESGANGSPVFRAEDVAGERQVAVTLLDRERPLETLRTAMGRLAAAPHPNLLENYAFSSCRGQPFIVNEWLNGFSLGDALRARRKAFTLAETHAVLCQAAAVVDHAATFGLGALDLRISAIQVHFLGGPVSGAECRRLQGEALAQWPEFLLKLRLRPPTDSAAAPEDAIRELGHLTAELLGSASSSTLAFYGADDTDLAVGLDGLSLDVTKLIGEAISPAPPFGAGSEFAAAFGRAYGAAGR